MEKRLYRSRRNRMIAGVCGGLGEYFGIDPTLIRLLWVVVTVFTALFGGIVVYAAFWIIVPEAPVEGANPGHGSPPPP